MARLQWAELLAHRVARPSPGWKVIELSDLMAVILNQHQQFANLGKQ